MTWPGPAAGREAAVRSASRRMPVSAGPAALGTDRRRGLFVMVAAVVAPGPPLC
jgi:hypothetical protein